MTSSTVSPGVARLRWDASLAGLEFGRALGLVTEVLETALATHPRVEALVDPDDVLGGRLATWAGMRREGVARGVVTDHEGRHDRVVYARLVDDVPVAQPEGFRALLNSFLPRKRAIAQMLLRDPDDRVLVCQLTYKRDWDLPGGVVEVGESPQLAVGREVEEELGLVVPPGPLLLTDWLPPWSGWDDALCLVFDGGVHEVAVLDTMVREEREIRAAAFLTADEVASRCSPITAARVRSALVRAWTDGSGGASGDDGKGGDGRAGKAYVESGR